MIIKYIDEKDKTIKTDNAVTKIVPTQYGLSYLVTGTTTYLILSRNLIEITS